MTESPELSSDVGNLVPIEQEIESMSKKQLVLFADSRLGATLDMKLSIDAMKKNILQFNSGRRKNAREESEASARQSASKDDPMVNVIFHNMQTAWEDITFNFPGPRGIFGPVNKKGHKKMPKYHLFPGMEISLPYSVVEHLESRTYTRHEAIFDPATGMQKGQRPVIAPRFILQQKLTREEAIALQELRDNKRE